METSTQTTDPAAESLAAEVRSFIESCSADPGVGARPVNPGHRVPFHWPPHPISYRYHLHPTDWRGKAEVTIHGESFDVQVAHTPHGVFGRCDAIWLEAKGSTLEEMLANLAEAAEPLFERQETVARTLGRERRFTGHIRDLSNGDLLRLLFCPDRDVSHEASTVIELRASQTVFLPALLEILRDERHPYRRAAQWAVLDLFEDLASFCRTKADEQAAVSAIRDLLWNAPDDYARAAFKAGVVLGGHMSAEVGGPVLLECLGAPSAIGRRSAIHGLFHVVEWDPGSRGAVVTALRKQADSDPEPALREYAAQMAKDIASGGVDHVAEPALPGEDGWSAD